MRGHVAFLLPFLLPGCIEREEILLDIEHYRVPCLRDAGLELCVLAKGDNDRAHKSLPRPIIGLAHTWGERSRIRVIREERFQTGQTDVIRMNLKEVLSTSEVEPDATFSYRFNTEDQAKGEQAVVLLGDGTGTLLGGFPFVCETEYVCDEIGQQIDGRGFLEIQLRYAGNFEDPFIAWDASFQPRR